MAKERRCNLWDDKGKPRLTAKGIRGCPRDASACHFAHPHERSWESAHPSHPPRSEHVVDSDSDFYYILAPPERRDRERERWDKERDKDRERRFGSPHRKPSKPGPSRKSTVDSAAEGSKRGRSPTLSACSDQLELLRKDSKQRTPLRQDAALSSSSMDRRVGMPPPKPPAVSDKVPSASPMPPPEPLKPPPMQPPPPPSLPALPNLPAFVSGQQPAETARGVKELSMEEQKSAWHERIDLMFASIASRRDYTKLESNLNQIRSLSNSPLVINMSEAERANINAQKMALELQMEVKGKEINDVIHKLIGSAFWPVLRAPGISEMEKTLGETKKHVLEVRGLLDDVKTSCAALLKTSSSDWTPDPERPSKRRKLEGSEDVSEDTTKELEAFRDKLTELDRHLVDLENDLIQRDKIISDEIELHIDARLEAEDALYPPIIEPKEVSPVEIEAVVDARNKEIVRAVTVTGEEIGALAMEVAELITKVNALEARCKVLEAENHEFKNKLTQNTLDCAKSQDELARRDKEIDAIAAALQAYISQSPATQPTGDLPSPEYIMEALDSQLDGLFRDKFSATLVSFQQDVVDKVQENQTRTFNAISPKIALLLKMVQLITARLRRSEEEAAPTG